ncbi:MAG: hypothetical protein KME29_08205 [Calothrix sp. FI2-JRJ7]|nr:hypothetical protein [Calothrix sp. FI2-JRJ7]
MSNSLQLQLKEYYQSLSTELPTTQSNPISPSPTPLSASSSLSSAVAADASGELGNISGNINYTGTAPQVIDPDLTITATSTNGLATLNGARVLIANFDASKDRLGIGGVTNGSESGVNWNYDQARGVLTLDSATGVSSDLYQDLLRRVTYANTDASNPGAARNIQFSLGNLLANPENQHFYEFVTNEGISWNDARTATNGLNYLGKQGYLATITTQAEQDFIQSRVSGNGWIGASDAVVEGDWRWVTGPEGLANNNTGTLFWRGNSTGAAIDGRYNNWDLQRGESNNSTDGGKPDGEDYAHIVGNANAGNIGKWNDLPNQQDYTNLAAYRPQGYIVEYGGLSTDSSPAVSASVTLNFTGTIGNAGTPAVGTTTTVPNFGGSADANGFNRPEILWRNYGNGSDSSGNVVWGINYDPANPSNPFSLNTDPRLTKPILPATDTNWEIEGLYDVDNNGITDIFWRNYNTGDNVVWFMTFDANTGIDVDLSSTTRTQNLRPVEDTNWEMEAVTNFGGSSGPQILWRNYRTGDIVIWAYNYDANVPGTAALTLDLSRSRTLAGNVPTDWFIEGWADFNNDAIPDILWRNYRTGENVIWKLNNTTTGNNPYFNDADGYVITPVADTQWEVADVIDFDADGVADILWRNYRTGENAIWGMQSGGDYDPAKTNPINTPAVTDTQWRLDGTADFTGDGVPDWVWRNYRTGENTIWEMIRDASNGNRYAFGAGSAIFRVEDVTWEIEGPSPSRDIV